MFTVLARDAAAVWCVCIRGCPLAVSMYAAGPQLSLRVYTIYTAKFAQSVLIIRLILDCDPRMSLIRVFWRSSAFVIPCTTPAGCIAARGTAAVRPATGALNAEV